MEGTFWDDPPGPIPDVLPVPFGGGFKVGDLIAFGADGSYTREGVRRAQRPLPHP